MDFLFNIKFLKILFLSISVFILLDFLWLAVISRKLYFNPLGYLAEIENDRIKFNLPVGLLVQSIIAMGLVVFIMITLQVQNSLGVSIAAGSFLGFVLYCTYDLTNLSFVMKYPVFITVVDIAWGTAQGFFAGIYVYYMHSLL